MSEKASNLIFPDIVFQVPDTLGANGVLGWYGSMLQMRLESMREGMKHRFVMVLPRPISVDRLVFLATEIKIFESWCEDHFNVVPYIDVI